MQQFKSFGLKNVHLEAWGKWDVGFDRGPSYGKMVVPFDMPIEFTTSSWGAGTSGPKRGIVVRMPNTYDEFLKVKDKLNGAWLFVPRFTRRSTSGTALSDDEKSKLDTAIANSGALGRVVGGRGDIVITAGNPRITMETIPKNLSIFIRKSDADRIDRNLDFGRTVELEFDIPVSYRRGPVTNYNVVADIPGSEKPDEMVIVGGHIDSWDGPGSQGALDNGTGTCTAIEAARILSKAGAKPKRTIRFVLWSGEEQGLFGSRGYVQAHEKEMDKVQAVLVDDGGTNYQGGYIGPEMYRSTMEAAFAPTVAAFPEFPMKYQVVKSIRNQETGSDHASFWKFGVPGFFTIETGRHNYNHIHHTQYDRYEEAIPEYLVQSSVNHAIVSLTLADAPVMMPRDMPKKKTQVVAAPTFRLGLPLFGCPNHLKVLRN